MAFDALAVVAGMGSAAVLVRGFRSSADGEGGEDNGMAGLPFTLNAGG